MKKLILAGMLSALSVSAFAADLSTEDQKISYAIGDQIGKSLDNVKHAIKLDEAILVEAITDALQDKPSQLDDEALGTAIESLRTKLAKYGEEQVKKIKEDNIAEAKKLLAENAKKDGVKTTKSGLQYRVIKAGTGKKPTADDTVRVNYKGTLADGTVFDDSSTAGQPVEFPLSAVISGWTEGLQLMPLGSTYEFVIPAELAYGDMAQPGIGPSRALIFEVELVAIVDTAEQNETGKQPKANPAEAEEASSEAAKEATQEKATKQ